VQALDHSDRLNGSGFWPIARLCPLRRMQRVLSVTGARTVPNFAAGFISHHHTVLSARLAFCTLNSTPRSELMSTHSFRPSVSVGALSLFIASLILLAGLSLPILGTSPTLAANKPSTDEIKIPRAEAADHDASVPAASSVTFPLGDDGQTPTATF
jgi:hypothetical protein